MKARTIVTLVIALVAGLFASLATYQLVRDHPHAARAPRADRGDSDPGLTP